MVGGCPLERSVGAHQRCRWHGRAVGGGGTDAARARKHRVKALCGLTPPLAGQPAYSRGCSDRRRRSPRGSASAAREAATRREEGVTRGVA